MNNALTTKEAAFLIGCGESTIRKYARIIGLDKFGKTWIIRNDDIDKIKQSIHHLCRKCSKYDTYVE